MEHVSSGGAGWGVALVLWLVVVLVGVVTGWRERITVFRDYDDLALVFFASAGVIAAFLSVVFFGQAKDWVAPVLASTCLVVAAVCGLFILGRTWRDNPSALWFVVALVTKLTLGALFLVNLVELIRPSGDTQIKRAKNRASALGFLVILSPIVLHLVRNPAGIWAPPNVQNQYQRGQVRL